LGFLSYFKIFKNAWFFMSDLHLVIQKRLKQLDKKFTRDKINSCLVYYKDTLVYEYYRNKKLKEKVHKVNSVTKSVMSILIGIAIDKGYINGVSQSISDFFPNMEESKRRITIEHLLTMTPGLDWPEFSTWGGRPMPMINSKDWVKFISERKMIEEPGENMYYNSGASHLLSAILQKATGQKATEFAENYLFHPLGIKEYDWYSDSKGIVIGGFGLSLKAEDMLKIGKFMLQGGYWENKAILSKSWIETSTSPKIATNYKFGFYGYHWWVLENENKKQHTFYAMGYGGQYIIIAPEYELITVFTSDNYADAIHPLTYFKSEILQAVRGE
jgi:CubicO group peptidase (beta-lactamase class C family)